MMDRIELVADPELTQFHEKTGGFPAIVELYREGQMTEARIDYPVGSAQRPMAWDDLAGKFRELTEGRWNHDTSQEIETRAADFLGQDDVRNLMRLL